MVGTDVDEALFEELLDAGLVAPVGTAADKHRDTLTARGYSHPALADRTVVRLAAGRLGPAEDLVMEHLGFDAPERPAVPVGVARRQALGFPGWVLVHDPASKHHALRVTKEIERCAQLAGSKQLLTKDDLDAVAATLPPGLRHFLPPLYEQVGRALLATGRTGAAAIFFSRARDAERTHKLTVDEDELAATHTEFALAGALPDKALSTYAKDLARRVAPDEAFRRLRRTCVARVAGGLAPHDGMQADLRRLIKAAKLNVATAEQELLRDLLPIPALARADPHFWAAYRQPLITLGQADPAARGHLLNLRPKTWATSADVHDEFWLTLLAQTGALAGLTEPAAQVPPEALPRAGAAEWLRAFADRNSYLDRFRPQWPKPPLIGLIREMAPRLRADGVPLRLTDAWPVNIDLLNLCLAEGVEVADPAPGFSFAPDLLSAHRNPTRSDLSAVAADPRFRPALRAAVDRIFQEPCYSSAQLFEVAGLRGILAEWLDTAADELCGSALPGADQMLRILGGMAKRGFVPAMAEINPGAWARIEAYDPAVTLAESLRLGILDEFGWPALETACAELTAPDLPTTYPRLWLIEQWPYLVAASWNRAAVVAHDAVLHRQDLPPLPRVPHSNAEMGLRWAEGQLSVTVTAFDSAQVTWSASPGTVHVLKPAASDCARTEPGSIELPDGTRSFGARPYRAGDAERHWSGPVATDGRGYWVLEHTDAGPYRTPEPGSWREFDPFTGEPGPVGRPRFFQDALTHAAPGTQLVDLAGYLLPLDSAAGPGPLGGAVLGTVGWRLTQDETGRLTGTGLDGRTIRVDRHRHPAQYGRFALVGAARFPGAAQDVALVWEDPLPHYQRMAMSLVTADGRTLAEFNTGQIRPQYARGTASVPPWRFWHYLTPRDPAGSAALRGLTTEIARAALRDLGGGEPDCDAAAIVRRHLPRISDTDLIDGVAGFLQDAQHCADRHADVIAAAATVPEPEPEPEPEPSPRPARQESAEIRLLRHIMDPAANPNPVIYYPPLELRVWPNLSSHLYLCAIAPWTGADRENTMRAVEHLADTGLLAIAGRIRILTLLPTAESPSAETIRTGGGHVVLTGRTDHQKGEWSAVQVGREGGGFDEIPGWGIVAERPALAWPWPETSPAEFARLLAESGPPPWSPQIAEQFAEAAGLTVAEATVILMGFPGYDYQGRFEPLTAELRDRFGFESADTYETAARRFTQLHADRADLPGELLPATARGLWTTGPDAERAARRWVRHHGRPIRLPEEFAQAASRDLTNGHYLDADPINCVRDLIDPEGVARLSTRPDLSDSHFPVFARALLWLAYRLPYGSDQRSHLPAAARAIRERLTEPGRETRTWYSGECDTAAAALGLTPGVDPTDMATVVGPLKYSPTYSRSSVIRPNLLSGPDDPALTLCAGTPAYMPQLEVDPVAILRLLLSTDLDRLLEHGQPVEGADPYPAQDPTRSVPALVSETAETLSLSPDAAALYLMLLALPDPTEENQASWTGWPAARLARARRELAATDLVVAGRRARVGRKLYLPGPWLGLKAPHMPVEAWKSASLGIGADGKVPLGVARPRVPVPELFHSAWQRVRDGDGPRIEEAAAG